MGVRVNHSVLYVSFLICTNLITPSMLFAQAGECIGMVRGAIVYDVKSCKVVSASEDFKKGVDTGFYKDMTQEDRTQFLTRYKGSLLGGKVVKSLAVRSGLDNKQGALTGKSVYVFLPADEMSCASIDNKRLAGRLAEACCNGSMDSPCLLRTPYVLREAKVVGEAGSAAGDAERTAAKKSKDYLEGLKAYRKKRYKQAIKDLERARGNGELDVAGFFFLGMAYRRTDQCRKTIPLLKDVFDRAEKGEIMADQEVFVRRSNFLLARCYALTNKPGYAVQILNSYLIEPKKYGAEIRQSLRHSDFGWINSSKEYSDYKKEARKRLREAKSR